MLSQTAQDHAAQVANLKVAKEEADAKQAQMQKSMKEELERIKTQFIFKVPLMAFYFEEISFVHS